MRLWRSRTSPQLTQGWRGLEHCSQAARAVSSGSRSNPSRKSGVVRKYRAMRQTVAADGVVGSPCSFGRRYFRIAGRLTPTAGIVATSGAVDYLPQQLTLEVDATLADLLGVRAAMEACLHGGSEEKE